MLLHGIDSQSLIIWLGNEDSSLDCFAGFLGMLLPFRIAVAIVTLNDEYPDPFAFRTPSGCFENDVHDPGTLHILLVPSRPGQ